jgi:hypothetical protein
MKDYTIHAVTPVQPESLWLFSKDGTVTAAHEIMFVVAYSRNDDNVLRWFAITDTDIHFLADPTSFHDFSEEEKMYQDIQYVSNKLKNKP